MASYYGLFMLAQTEEGVRSIEPAGGGFDGHETAYFMHLECATCHEVTAKDVCLYPGLFPCARRAGGESAVTSLCFPKCEDSGHLVRKCKVCGIRGSLSLLPGHGKKKVSGNETVMVMMMHCRGYTPIGYSPSTAWTVTMHDGESYEVDFTQDQFQALDDPSVQTTAVCKYRFQKLSKTEVLEILRES